MAAARTRRRPEEVRTLLIAGARQVFAANGYRGATTAEIAAAAGVSESALFRHFANKEELFSAAAVEPFRQFIAEFADVWQRLSASDATEGEPMRAFVTELYDHVDASREIVQALLVGDVRDGDLAVAGARREFAGVFAQLEAIGQEWAEKEGVAIAGLELRERILVGMVTSMVLHDGWFLTTPDGERFPRETVIDALVDFAHYGATERWRREANQGRR